MPRLEMVMRDPDDERLADTGVSLFFSSFFWGGAVKHKAQNKKYVPICPNPGVILGIQCLLVLCLTKMPQKTPTPLLGPQISQ